MKIGFYLYRDATLKAMGALIEAAVREQHSVSLLFDQTPFGGDKAHQQLNDEKLGYFEQFGLDLIGTAGDDLSAAITRLTLDVLFVHEGFHTLRPHLNTIQDLRNAGVKVVSLPHFFEVAHHPVEALNAFDLTVYMSEHARQAHFQIAQTAVTPTYESRSFIGGSPMFDQLRRLDKTTAKAELGLPADRPVVLLMSPVISAITPWRHRFWNGQSMASRIRNALIEFNPRNPLQNWVPHDWSAIFAEIRAFADRSNALLVTKSRGKQPNQVYEVSGSDRYYDGMDDVYYPFFSTYTLMAAADLCISVNSMAAAEAVAVGIPSINIHPPHLDFSGKLSPHDIRYYDEFLGGKPGTLLNYSGCVWSVHHRKAISTLRRSSLKDFKLDARARQTYVSKFLGIEAEPSSQRILSKIAS
jgi:hypothetical protein